MNGFNDYTFIIVLVTLAVLAVLLQTYLEIKKRPKEPKTITRTLLKCIKCNYREEANYEVGDFIGLLKKKCSKCGQPMKIIAIYSIEIKEKA